MCIVCRFQAVNGPYRKSAIFTAQNARTSITCIECNKPRVLYSKVALSNRQIINLENTVAATDYTCGAPILPENNHMYEKVKIRENLGCASPIEFPYYSGNVGPKDLCAYCALPESLVCESKRKIYQIVLPLCNNCSNLEIPLVRMPFGKREPAKKNAKKDTRHALE